MIAYNKTWLANLRLQKQLETDFENGSISHDEFKAIKEKYPVGFYTPGILARVGLFILTCIVMIFAGGILALMAGNAISNAGFPIFLGILSYAGLEFMVNANNHYRSGVDDALLFISWCCIFLGLGMLLYNQPNHIILSGSMFLLSLFFAIRFADMLMSAVSGAFFIAFIFFSWDQLPVGLLTTPLVIIPVAVAMYWLCRTSISKIQLINYENCLLVLQIVSLVVLYAAGNYHVVRSIYEEFAGASASVNLPGGPAFWAWTMLVPFVYVGFGLKKKDAVLLRVGLILIAAAVITFKTYYHILPVDITLTIAGAMILAIAYGVMQYLKTPKHGFTYAEPDKKHAMDHLKVESLIIAETFATAPAPPANDGVKFGGGDFGGGGSSDTF
jgi:hypothetical protein